MKNRIRSVSIVALCVTALVAIAAPVVSAAVTESNTAFTCVKGVHGGFKNADCNSGAPAEEGEWGHVAIGKTATLPAIKVLGSQQFKFTYFTSNFFVTATKVECIECVIENHEEVIEGKQTVMDVSGSGRLLYTGVTFSASGCTVMGKQLFTERLKWTTTSATQMEFTPVSGSTVAVLHFESGFCPFGSNLTFAGLFRGTLEGATVKFATGAGELEVSTPELLLPAVAHLSGEWTTSAGLKGSSERNPLSFTKA